MAPHVKKSGHRPDATAMIVTKETDVATVLRDFREMAARNAHRIISMEIIVVMILLTVDFKFFTLHFWIFWERACQLTDSKTMYVFLMLIISPKWNGNPVNSGNLINHRRMNCGPFKNSVSRNCLTGTVVSSTRFKSF